MSMVKVMVCKEEMQSKKMDMSSEIVEKIYRLREILNVLNDSQEKTQSLAVLDEVDAVARDLRDIIYKEAVE
jgi:hypothetical protein